MQPAVGLAVCGLPRRPAVDRTPGVRGRRGGGGGITAHRAMTHVPCRPSFTCTQPCAQPSSLACSLVQTKALLPLAPTRPRVADRRDDLLRDVRLVAAAGRRAQPARLLEGQRRAAHRAVSGPAGGAGWGGVAARQQAHRNGSGGLGGPEGSRSAAGEQCPPTPSAAGGRCAAPVSCTPHPPPTPPPSLL